MYVATHVMFIQDSLSCTQVSSRLIDAMRLVTISRRIEVIASPNNLLERLPRAKYASFVTARPDRPSTCLSGTRTAVLNDIREWMMDRDPSARRVFLLHGVVGTGKTAIAATIAQLAQEHGMLAADFFFSQTAHADLKNPALIFPSLAYQFALFDPAYGQRLTETLKKDPVAPYMPPKEQLNQLLIRPLSNLEYSPLRGVIVLDAFNECETSGAREVLDVLIAGLPELPSFIKILLTSRPDHYLLSLLRPSADVKAIALQDIETSIVKRDIRLFLGNRLRNIPRQLRINLREDWVTDQEVDRLAEKADDLFSLAATMIRFVSDITTSNPRVQLNSLLALKPDQEVPYNPLKGLDATYNQVLRLAIPSHAAAEHIEHFQCVVGSTILLRDSLPASALERMTSLSPGSVDGVLLPLDGVIALDPPEFCPRVYHPSFISFITDPSRCKDDRLRIDTGEHEARMARACLALMNSSLHKDMLGVASLSWRNADIRDLGGKIQDALPSELRYSCRSWASHLARAKAGDVTLLNLLEKFCDRMLLPWLEIMSLLGETGNALQSLAMSKTWTVRLLRYSFVRCTG